MKNLYVKSILFWALFSIVIAACDDSDTHAPTDGNKGTDTGTSEDCDGVSNVTVGVLEREIELEGQAVTKKVNTVLMVNWDQIAESDSVKLRFTFENDEWFESPAEPGAVGEHEIPVLGVPESTDVTIQIVGETDGDETVCETTGTTGKIPDSIPRATVSPRIAGCSAR